MCISYEKNYHFFINIFTSKGFKSILNNNNNYNNIYGIKDIYMKFSYIYIFFLLYYIYILYLKKYKINYNI